MKKTLRLVGGSLAELALAMFGVIGICVIGERLGLSDFATGMISGLWMGKMVKQHLFTPGRVRGEITIINSGVK